MYYDLSKVSLPLLQRLVSGQKVGDKLFAGLVHDSSDHGLGHHLHLLSRADPCWGGISVEDDLTELALMYDEYKPLNPTVNVLPNRIFFFYKKVLWRLEQYFLGRVATAQF